MRALTVHQPYAELIMRGNKTIEVRSWATDHRGPLIIHAGRDMANRRHWPSGAVEMLADVDVQYSAVLGMVTLERVEYLHAVRAWAWVLGNPRRFDTPIPMPGRQGLWDYTPSLVIP